MTQEDELKKLTGMLQNLSKNKFWGEVTIVYREGRPTFMRKNETIPLDGRTGNAKQNISS